MKIHNEFAFRSSIDFMIFLETVKVRLYDLILMNKLLTKSRKGGDPKFLSRGTWGSSLLRNA